MILAAALPSTLLAASTPPAPGTPRQDPFPPDANAAGSPPRYPACMDAGITIDFSRLERLRSEYQGAQGQDASDVDFMFSWLPGRIFSGILYGEFHVHGLPSDFGLAYWSGFNGGIWLNRSIHSGDDLGIAPAWLLGQLRRPMLCYLGNRTSKRLKLIETGGTREKRKTAEESVGFLARTYGYNRGYLVEIVEHPPAGAKGREDILVCGDFLDCRYGLSRQDILEQLLPVRAKLSDPPDRAWEKVAGPVRHKLPCPSKPGAWFGG